jgi:hypothetical protein
VSADEETTTDSTTTTTSTSSDGRPPVLAVDLDETIIQSDTEEEIPGARDALLALRKLGWKIIIWTARGDVDTHVPEILERHGIPFDAINENLPGMSNNSRKVHFDAVVDNKNVDFHDGWEAVVEELEHRRKGWKDKSVTKATIFHVDPVSGETEALQEWGLDKDGCAVLLKGDASVVEFDMDASPEDGEEFLKELERSVNNTYLFAEVARGKEFLFAPRERVRTNFGSDKNHYSRIFEGINGNHK